jgi:microcystin-dependent protein
MSNPYVGEIRIFAGNFAPAGWAFCDGSLLPISENETLFQLIGTTYGGDGQSTFALPDMQARLPVHQGVSSEGNQYVMGEAAGVMEVTLTAAQVPSHTHPLLAATGVANPASAPVPGGAAIMGQTAGANIYALGGGAAGQMRPNVLAYAGSSQPHANMMPYLGVHYIISLFGYFPSP